MSNRVYNCPECNHETVVETEKVLGITYEIERCDGLIETSPSQPLNACMWSQELRILSNGITTEV